MKTILRNHIFVSALTLLAFGLAGCGNSTSPKPPVTPVAQINFTIRAQTKFQQNYLDTTGGKYGNDSINTASVDTLAQILDTTGLAYLGATNVNRFLTNHSKPGVSQDTTNMYQVANGDLYTQDYGVEVLNNIPVVLAFNGGLKFHIGWVLQMKMAAPSGTPWLACDTGLGNLPFIGNIGIRDSATIMDDVVLNVAGEQLTTKHAVHNVTVTSSLAIARTRIDTYVSLKYGTVYNVVHSSQLTGSFTNHVVGVRTILLTHS